MTKFGIFSLLYIVVPIIILYIFFAKIVISREKDKKIRLKNCLVLFFSLMMILMSIGLIKILIVNSAETTIKYGYTDAQKKILIEPKYEYAEDFYNGLAKIGIKKYHLGINGLYFYEYGFINSAGETVIEPMYSELSYFNDMGYAYGKKYDSSYVAETVEYYRLYQNGNTELITGKEYYKNKDIKQGKKDENIILKENSDTKIHNMPVLLFVISLFAIIILLSVIIIIKIIKKEEKMI